MTLSVQEMREKLVFQLKGHALDYILRKLKSFITGKYTFSQERYAINRYLIMSAIEKLPFPQDNLQEIFPTDNRVRTAYVFSNKCSVFREQTLDMILLHYMNNEMGQTIRDLQSTAINEQSDSDFPGKSEFLFVDYLIRTGQLVRVQ
ncbi:MAG: hypothetical protein WCI52_00740 [bacterium]